MITAARALPVPVWRALYWTRLPGPGKAVEWVQVREEKPGRHPGVAHVRVVSPGAHQGSVFSVERSRLYAEKPEDGLS